MHSRAQSSKSLLRRVLQFVDEQRHPGASRARGDTEPLDEPNDFYLEPRPRRRNFKARRSVGERQAREPAAQPGGRRLGTGYGVNSLEQLTCNACEFLTEIHLSARLEGSSEPTLLISKPPHAAE